MLSEIKEQHAKMMVWVTDPVKRKKTKPLTLNFLLFLKSWGQIAASSMIVCSGELNELTAQLWGIAFIIAL